MGGLFANWLTQQVPLLLPYYIFFFSFAGRLIPDEVLAPTAVTFFAPVHYASMNSSWIQAQLERLLDGYLLMLRAALGWWG